MSSEPLTAGNEAWITASFAVADRWPDLMLPEGFYPTLRAALAAASEEPRPRSEGDREAEIEALRVRAIDGADLIGGTLESDRIIRVLLAALPSPRSDRLLTAVRTLAPIAHLWEPDEAHRRTGGPVLGDFALCDHPRCRAANELLNVAAPRSDDREGTLREAAENVAAHHNGEPGHDMNDRCWPTLYRILTRAALHSAPDTVDETTP